jgi:chemotaxis protein methyltransferase CheR
VRDSDFVAFLQRVLPHLGMRWPGFRKVRGQVRKRIARRIAELGLPGLPEYAAWLDAHPGEWPLLDGLCRISISRFRRDRAVFEHLEREALPRLAAGAGELRAWSAGCAGGEEPYSLALLWRFALADRFPACALRILATDADERQIARAETACYPPGSLRELPSPWRLAAFDERTGLACLRPEIRAMAEFRVEDMRQTMPRGPFHVVLCRNAAFTYFDIDLQLRIAAGMREQLAPGGILVVGIHETPPEGAGFRRIAPAIFAPAQSIPQRSRRSGIL